jgi:hypothetical protein
MQALITKSAISSHQKLPVSLNNSGRFCVLFVKTRNRPVMWCKVAGVNIQALVLPTLYQPLIVAWLIDWLQYRLLISNYHVSLLLSSSLSLLLLCQHTCKASIKLKQSSFINDALTHTKNFKINIIFNQNKILFYRLKVALLCFALYYMSRTHFVIKNTTSQSRNKKTEVLTENYLRYYNCEGHS